jgi:flagellar motor switch protein FliN/FliY
MPTPEQVALAEALGETWAKALSAAIEAMVGLPPSVEPGEAPAMATDDFYQTDTLSLSAQAAISVRVPREAWFHIGATALTAVGVEDADEESVRGTFLEILTQAHSALVRDVGGRAGKELTIVSTRSSPIVGGHYLQFRLELSGSVHPLVLQFSSGLLEALAAPQAVPEEVQARAAAAGAASGGAGAVSDSPYSRTLDLILDVELPISISFGRAQVPLKEVLKLTSGSIVELNRAVAEPVEMIVNNCVIARGEVVVVEGNYGIRIQEIVSRSERLRTLN